jgi:hypothetical protein
MTDVLELVMKRQWEASQRGVLSTWTIYDHPDDCPGLFVARRFESGKGKPEPVPTIDAFGSHELEPLRRCFELAGLVVIPRYEADEPQIVEVWL